MRLPTTKFTKAKNVLHLVQGVVVALAILVTIGVFVSHGPADGRTGWFFGLCWLTLPILVYQAMVPVWSRARKFANIYAFASLDCFAAIAWLSAWAAVTNYVVTGKGKGDVPDASGCANFKYGSTNKCRLSEASIVFGVIVMLLFVATALISLKDVMEYQRTGVLPIAMDNGGVTGNVGPLGGVKATGTGVGHVGHHPDDDEEAFDSNMNLRHDWEVDEYDHDDYHDRYGAAPGAGYTSVSGIGASATQGYAPARREDHGVDYDNHPPPRIPAGSNLSAGSNRYAANSSQSNLGEYSDDHDLHTQRPASTGPGPLGADTTYHSSTYGQGTLYGR